MFCNGVDLGGTNLRAIVVDTDTGRVLADARGPTNAEDGPPAVIERKAVLIEQSIQESGLAKDEIVAIGIGVPGLYDPETNVVRFLTNLPTTWPNVPLGREIESRVGSIWASTARPVRWVTRSSISMARHVAVAAGAVWRRMPVARRSRRWASRRCDRAGRRRSVTWWPAI